MVVGTFRFRVVVRSRGFRVGSGGIGRLRVYFFSIDWVLTVFRFGFKNNFFLGVEVVVKEAEFY